jgi:hypothetical protein
MGISTIESLDFTKSRALGEDAKSAEVTSFVLETSRVSLEN